jgi:hypothetical protein
MIMTGTTAGSYTFWEANINNATGALDHRQLWQNMIHGNQDFVNLAVNTNVFLQSYNRPVYAFTYSVDSSTLQSVNTDWEISLSNSGTGDFNSALISNNFRTSVGIVSGQTVVSTNNHFQRQQGTILSAVKNNNPSINTINIYGTGGEAARSYNTKVEIWLKQRNLIT